MISKVVSKRTGIPLSEWDDPIKSVENVFKTAGTLWSYGEKYIPDTVDGLAADGDVWDVSFSKFKESKFLKDVCDVVRDTNELLAPHTNLHEIIGGPIVPIVPIDTIVMGGK